MPSAFRNPKNLPEWLQLDFFRRRRDLGRVKRALIWGTLVVTVVGSAAAYFVPGVNRMLQAGPVSAAHGFFNNDCSQCHVEPFQTARRFYLWDGTVRGVPNEACVKCHDGPPHNMKQGVELDCSACHREHRGRPVLARVPDNDCTTCHADLKANLASGVSTRFEDVGGFPSRHPDFAIWRGDDPLAPEGKDPGQLRFNHAVHLNSDGLIQPDGSRKVMECGQCHQGDTAGRYMLPINYEQHCKVCHPLSIRLVGRFATPELQRAADQFAKEPAPHREPAIVRAVLRDRTLQFARQNRVAPAEDKGLELLFPKPRRMQPQLEQLWGSLARESTESERSAFGDIQLRESERRLFQLSGGCVYCHIEKTDAEQPAFDNLPAFLATNLRNRWLPHSKFRHDAHRMLSCTECHDAKASTATSDVLLPKLDTCARCHNASKGARSDCVECHNYHARRHGNEPHKGRTIDESLGTR